MGSRLIVGTSPKIISGAKDYLTSKGMGAMDVARSGYSGGEMFGRQIPGIKDVPFSPKLSAAMMVLRGRGAGREF